MLSTLCKVFNPFQYRVLHGHFYLNAMILRTVVQEFNMYFERYIDLKGYYSVLCTLLQAL